MKIFRTILACIFLFGQADFSLLQAQVIQPIASPTAVTLLSPPVYSVDNLFNFDALNRSTAQTYADSTMNIANTYDLGSRLTRAQNSFSDIQVGYDKLNRVVSDKQIFGALTYEVVNQYDKAGNRTKATYPSGKVVDQLFNDIDQVTTMKVNGTNVATYAYDPLNRPTQKDLLGGATKSAVFGYDAGDQLLTLENKLAPSTLISKHTATYDKTGNRLTHANQQTAGTVNLAFVYSKINELTSVTGGQTHTYAYDKVGNRTNADGVAYVTNSLNQYTKVAGVNHIYDNNGNLTQEPTVNYVYDAENRLLQATKAGTVGQYRYDAFNRRISKDVGGNKIFYVHDGDDVIEERNTTGTLIADYVNGPRVDEVLTMTRGGQTYYYFYDALGSVRQITNAAGTVVEAYDYDVFGKPLNTSAVGNPAMFTGRWFDAESGNYYYRARYYSPNLGRFLQRDPMGYHDSMNVYEYALNNPFTYLDPFGLAVGAPGTAGSMVPIYGSGRAAINDFQEGRLGWGAFNSVMTISDILLVKAIGTGIVKGAVKIEGSHSWSAVRKWLGKKGFAEAQQHVHHSIIPQGGWGKNIANWFKNQPWNLRPLNPPPGISMDMWHKMIEGKIPGLNLMERWWYGTPDWIRALEVSTSGRIINMGANNECE